MSHDLIAAGHPPLRFELVNYLNAMPPHWNTRAATERHGTGFTAKLWTVSQLVSAQAAVDVLNYRAKQTEAPSRKQTPWPEFAEYDCFACHHNLAQPSWRQRQRKPRTPIRPSSSSSAFACARQMRGSRRSARHSQCAGAPRKTSAGAMTAAGITDSRLRVVRGTSHLAPYQTPGPVTAAILGHLGVPEKLR